MIIDKAIERRNKKMRLGSEFFKGAYEIYKKDNAEMWFLVEWVQRLTYFHIDRPSKHHLNNQHSIFMFHFPAQSAKFNSQDSTLESPPNEE